MFANIQLLIPKTHGPTSCESRATGKGTFFLGGYAVNRHANHGNLSTVFFELSAESPLIDCGESCCANLHRQDVLYAQIRVLLTSSAVWTLMESIIS
jgi:hypothetical protein